MNTTAAAASVPAAAPFFGLMMYTSAPGGEGVRS